MQRQVKICQRSKRILKQMQQLRKQIGSGVRNDIRIIEIGQNQQNGKFAFAGPYNTPYEGFWIEILFQWSQHYPFHPPKVMFLRRLWNPYVDFQTRQICMDIFVTQFSPALTTEKLILSISSLIAERKIQLQKGQFINPKAAAQIKNNYNYFFQQAKQICQNEEYEKENVYGDIIRGIPFENHIIAEGQQFEKIIDEQIENGIFIKKEMKYFNPDQFRKLNLSKEFQNKNLFENKQQQIQALPIINNFQMVNQCFTQSFHSESINNQFGSLNLSGLINNLLDGITHQFDYIIPKNIQQQQQQQ